VGLPRRTGVRHAGGALRISMMGAYSNDGLASFAYLNDGRIFSTNSNSAP